MIMASTGGGVVIGLALFLLRTADAFCIEETSIQDIQVAFKAGTLTSRKLVEYYIDRVAQLNPVLNAIIEVNPDALELADEADRQRKLAGGYIGGLHGVPILLKDNIATADKLNTTAGSFALLGSVVPRDAGIVARLRKAGAIIFGKANLSEWANIRSINSSNGWSARGGQTKDPYNLDADPCGSSTGSAVAVAANMVSVSIGTETDGSILCPASSNAVVGIKPTVGLTSRAGVVPISHNQDTVGPICRTVSDAVEVLDKIAGFDVLDNATRAAARLIPKGGYKQFLNDDGLHGKQLGVLRHPFFDQTPESEAAIIDELLSLIKSRGALITENLTLPNAKEMLSGTSEQIVLLYDLKQDLNSYLSHLVKSPVRSLADVIEFNNAHADQELSLFGQELFLLSEATTGLDSHAYKKALKRDKFLTKHGVDKLFETYKLDALVAPTSSAISTPAAIAGYPAISLPAGYSSSGVPFGVTFLGTKGSEPILIEIGYAFERATKVIQISRYEGERAAYVEVGQPTWHGKTPHVFGCRPRDFIHHYEGLTKTNTSHDMDMRGFVR